MIEDRQIKKILYINLAFLGDLLLSVPALRALRERYPQSVIHMLVTPWAMPAALGNPYVDQVYEYDKKGRHRNVKALWELICSLRQEKYDVIISANFAVRGAMLAKVVGAKYRIGYDAQHASFFLTHSVSCQRTVVKHETENQMAVLAPLGVSTKDYSLGFKINPEDIKSVGKKVTLSFTRKNVAICPFGRHPLNSWTMEGYVEVVKQLSEEADCYLIGGKQEEERLQQINDQAGDKAKILAGELTIGELAAFLAQCHTMLTVDTGPMHLAGAVGVPIVALFGRSDPRVWGPRGGKDVILKGDLDCIPCIIPRECEHHSCMKQITVKQVVDTVQAILKME